MASMGFSFGPDIFARFRRADGGIHPRIEQLSCLGDADERKGSVSRGMICMTCKVPSRVYCCFLLPLSAITGSQTPAVFVPLLPTRNIETTRPFAHRDRAHQLRSQHIPNPRSRDRSKYGEHWAFSGRRLTALTS
jgi:hypothetical protein